MIVLHQYPPAWRLSSLSPFCIKVETYLRMAGLPYELVNENNPLRGPRGRMPFIEHGDRVVSDSRLILEDLEARSPAPLDAHLTPSQRAVSLAFHRLMDQDLYRVILYSRWVDPDGWRVLRGEFKPFFPRGLRTLALGAIRQSLVLEAWANDITELTRDEVYALGDRHLETLEAALGDKPFFHGERPTTVDATLYAFLSVILETPIDVPLRRSARAKPSLVGYCERIRNAYSATVQAGQ